MKSAVVTRANRIPRTYTRSEAFKMAWKAERLEQQLKASESVNFAFTKEDGTFRHATGTKVEAVVSQHWQPTGKGQKNPLIINFFDIQILQWRSCRIDRLAA